MRRLIPIYAIFTALTLIVSASCNTTGSDETDPTVISTNTLVTNFYIQANDSVLTLLDSIPFTIDVNKRVIYNADSLPKGTDITRLVPSITLASTTSTGVITISGASTMSDTTYTYTASSTDSIDFTGRVMLTVKAADGISSRDYQLLVNVHQMESDSLYWNQLSRRNLPGSLTGPEQQKTVESNGTTYCLVAENGTYTVSSTTEPATNNWDKQKVFFGFTPNVSSLTATTDALYILDTDGNLQKSTNGGLSWAATGKKYYSLISGYGSTLLAVAAEGTSYFTATLTTDGTETLKAANSQFPVSGASQAVTYDSKWGTSQMLMVVGGKMADGNYTGMTWGYDGNAWEAIGNRQVARLSDMTLVKYYYFQRLTSGGYQQFPVLLAFGGRTSDGSLSKKVYISYNNGIDWKLGDDLLQLPDYINAFYGAQAVVSTSTLESTRAASAWTAMPSRHLPVWLKVDVPASTRSTTPITSWDCPYIYLFGGYNESGELQNNIWKGVVNRLTFKPIQ